jgi:hypothetical protein
MLSIVGDVEDDIDDGAAGELERVCCIERSLVILTEDLPARGTSSPWPRLLRLPEPTADALQSRLVDWPTVDLTVKITRERSMQQSRRSRWAPRLSRVSWKFEVAVPRLTSAVR